MGFSGGSIASRSRALAATSLFHVFGSEIAFCLKCVV